MGPHKDIEDIYRTTEALMVLHNMAIRVWLHCKHSIDFNDRPSDKWRLDKSLDDQDTENDGDEEPPVQIVVGQAQVPAYETDNYLKEQGRIKQLALLNKLF
ncbi:hypothetical protein K438DRAFT_2104790 [Mycena galopus ATCC 62051]|nr:hypothetical protein K438DRAFT_2104790 [Mycena galopus ATCC 62051]